MSVRRPPSASIPLICCDRADNSLFIISFSFTIFFFSLFCFDLGAFWGVGGWLTQQRKEKHSGNSKEERKSNGHLQSPYGCHAVPDIAKSLHPKLNSLPNEPLRKGEQYFLDLAGNIQKVFIFCNPNEAQL